MTPGRPFQTDGGTENTGVTDSLLLVLSIFPTQAENTYLLTLDGDIDFKAESVTLLVDRMKKNKKVGAACGRIHPIGTGLVYLVVD